jgi:hypothetical protein
MSKKSKFKSGDLVYLDNWGSYNDKEHQEMDANGLPDEVRQYFGRSHIISEVISGWSTKYSFIYQLEGVPDWRWPPYVFKIGEYPLVKLAQNLKHESTFEEKYDVL